MGDLTRGKTLPDSADKADFHDLIDDTTIAADKITAAMIKDGVVSEAKLDATSAPQTNYVMRYDGTKMDWIAQTSLLSISDPYTNQDVRTTASPTFVDVTTTSVIASSLASIAEIKATYLDVGSIASLANINVTNVNGSAYSSKTFGNWSLIGSLATVSTLASSDGYIIAEINADTNGDWGEIIGYTDSSNPPTTARVSASGWHVDSTFSGSNGTQRNSFTMPVKSGEYWKVFHNFNGGTPTVTINWLPQA